MPANLPPQYKEVEATLKTAKTPEEKIAIYEKLLAMIPKHKGTEKIQAMHKTKIAKLKVQLQKKPQTAKHGYGFHIERTGAGQVVLVGPPNSGKSSLIKSLTNAEPDIGDYPFTTHTPAPAMMKYENIQIQLIDTPPITLDYMETWHSELIKSSDGIVLILDASSEDSPFDLEVIKERLSERNVKMVPEKMDIPPEKKQHWKRTIMVANKKDKTYSEEILDLIKETVGKEFSVLAVSAQENININLLKQRIFQYLQILRVYSKLPGKKADQDDPFVFKCGSTLMDMARSVHKDFAENLKFARIWGKGKYQGQKVNREYVLQDEDIIELHI
jgi:small GTP-binding protein